MKRTDFLKEIIYSAINESFNSDSVDYDNLPTIVNQIAEDFKLDLHTGIGFMRGFTAARDYTILCLIQKMRELTKLGQRDSEEMQKTYDSLIKVINNNVQIDSDKFTVGSSVDEYIEYYKDKEEPFRLEISYKLYKMYEKQKKGKHRKYDVESFIEQCNGEKVSIHEYSLKQYGFPLN